MEADPSDNHKHRLAAVALAALSSQRDPVRHRHRVLLVTLAAALVLTARGSDDASTDASSQSDISFNDADVVFGQT